MQQLSLMLEPSLATVHPSLKACVNYCVQSGIGVVAVAGKLDKSHSHLSEALSGSERRKFDVDDLEDYIAATGDTRPIQYLIAKFMRDPLALKQEALAQLVQLAEAVPHLMVAAGIAPKPRRAGRA